ncbi:hypothetical protein DPEC_G00229610 [Dallia pectoralis]|uniref:Uncharacterized protein n=1 Tax=Dallia pectoralis TaxID=75939 RepID=A0ACC2G173_DALPE|nr:hypothetical protein DPEC_G00229610 [Dallia pectoralis]
MNKTGFLIILSSGLCSLALCISRQYHFVNKQKTWTEAQSYCRETYTDLASISDQNDQDSLNSLFTSRGSYSGQAWIGLKYDSWRWSLEDTETGGVSNGWSGGYPWYQYGYSTYSNDQQECVMMYTTYGRWYGGSCDSSNYFVCYDGRENANQTFILVTQPKTWYQAQSYCREHYTDLAVVRDQTENQAIFNISQNAGYTCNWLWIGLYRTGSWSNKGNSSVSTSTYYHLVNKQKTWTEAQSYCRLTYTDLATVSDSEDYDSLICLINSTLGNSSQAWVGLKFSNWRWSVEDNVTEVITDGWSEYPWSQTGSTFNDWQKTCVLMNAYDRQWQGHSCDSFYTFFVCYDGKQNASQTFILVTQWSTWHQAQSYCREHYTDLAVVRNQTEYQAIKDLTQNLYYYSVWIGLYRNGTWSDGDTSSNYYLQYNGLNQSCATAQYSRNYNVYNTENCNNTMSFVCYGAKKNKSLTAKVFCNESSMTVSVERSSIVGLLVDHLRLSDPSCSLYSNSTHIYTTLDLNTCGTQLEDDGDNLIFRNVITSFDDSSDVITREQQVEAELSCVFPKKANVSLEFLVHKIPYIFREKGFGKFTYQFEFFHNSLYNSLVDPASYPVKVDLKEMIYMEITSTTSFSNTEIFVESCQATPSDNPDDPTHYSIIQNGCNKDDTVQIYPSSRSQFRFGMEAFTFIGLHDQVYISCSVIQCKTGNPNTRCAEGCINGTSRRRRDANLQTTSHYISQGPLRVRRNAESQGFHATLNLNLVVFIAGCLLVCGVVIYRSRESKVKYQRLPTA